jgi:hypothetical protein
MSTATTSDKFTTDKYTQIRGELRAVHGHGALVLVVTVHPEGQPTALYRLNLDSGELTSGPLGGGATAILTDDTHVWLAGTDGHIYKADIIKRCSEAARAEARAGPDGPRVRQQGPPRRRVRQGARDRRPQRRQGDAAPHARRVRRVDRLGPERRLAGRRRRPRHAQRVRLRGQGQVLRGRVEEAARGRDHRPACSSRRSCASCRSAPTTSCC